MYPKTVLFRTPDLSILINNNISLYWVIVFICYDDADGWSCKKMVELRFDFFLYISFGRQSQRVCSILLVEILLKCSTVAAP